MCHADPVGMACHDRLWRGLSKQSLRPLSNHIHMRPLSHHIHLQSILNHSRSGRIPKDGLVTRLGIRFPSFFHYAFDFGRLHHCTFDFPWTLALLRIVGPTRPLCHTSCGCEGRLPCPRPSPQACLASLPNQGQLSQSFNWSSFR